jgi:hypothetical protein
MIGSRPKFLDSPYFYEDAKGWHLKPGAPKEVQDEFNDFMEEAEQGDNAPGN